MPFQHDGRPAFRAATDVFTVSDLGFLPERPVAAEVVFPRGKESCPVFFLGPPNKIHTLNAEMFSAVSAFGSIVCGRSLPINYPAKEVYIDDGNVRVSWSKVMDLAFRELLKKYGFKGAFSLSLQRLIMLGEGASIQLGHRNGECPAFANMLVDLPFAYADGTIHVTNGGLTVPFDFSSPAGDALSTLFWFHDSTVSIEPISSGFRAVLLYDVNVVDNPTIYPWALLPKSGHLNNIDAKLRTIVPTRPFRDLHPKTCFLPLVRLIVFTQAAFESEIPEVPTNCYELCSRVVVSHEKRMKDAIKAGVGPDVVSEIRNEHREVLWSFGGNRSMARFLKPEWVRELKSLIKKLESQDHFVHQ